MKQRFGTLALIGAVALLAGGCGSSKHPSSTGTVSTSTAATKTAAATTTSTPASTSAGGTLSQSAYDSEMVTLGKVLGTSLSTLPSAANAKEAAAALVKVQEDVRNLAKNLQAIKAPTPVTADHAQLVTAVSNLADQMSPVIAKLKKGNFKALGQVATLPAFDAISAAVTKIESAGYTIGTA